MRLTTAQQLPGRRRGRTWGISSRELSPSGSEAPQAPGTGLCGMSVRPVPPGKSGQGHGDEHCDVRGVAFPDAGECWTSSSCRTARNVPCSPTSRGRRDCFSGSATRTATSLPTSTGSSVMQSPRGGGVEVQAEGDGFFLSKSAPERSWPPWRPHAFRATRGLKWMPCAFGSAFTPVTASWPTVDTSGWTCTVLHGSQPLHSVRPLPLGSDAQPRPTAAAVPGGQLACSARRAGDLDTPGSHRIGPVDTAEMPLGQRPETPK
jgi:hypothetical protein